MLQGYIISFGTGSPQLVEIDMLMLEEFPGKETECWADV